jgi:hypothetical protein
MAEEKGGAGEKVVRIGRAIIHNIVFIGFWVAVVIAFIATVDENWLKAVVYLLWAGLAGFISYGYHKDGQEEREEQKEKRPA